MNKGIGTVMTLVCTVVGGFVVKEVVKLYGDHRYVQGFTDAIKMNQDVLELKDFIVDVLSEDKKEEEA